MIDFYKMWKTNSMCKNTKREIKEINFSQNIYLNYTIIDIRGRKEYKEDHLKYSTNIPLFNLKHDISKYIKNYDDKILVYCDSRCSKQKSSVYIRKTRIYQCV